MVKAPRTSAAAINKPVPNTTFAVFQSTLCQRSLIFENWKLGIKENYNSYTRSGGSNIPPKREGFLKAGILRKEFC